MIPLALPEIAAIVGGEVADDPDGVTVTGPAFRDNREPEPGGLFVALAGERVDGHDFARAAVDAGARAVLAARPTGVPSVVVPDVVAALQDLAGEVLRRLRRDGGGPAVVAVTGSQGKTSVKDMLAWVLADEAPTVATYGSLNNEIGLPLTVLYAGPDTRHLVLEMGARGIGHLARLCEIAPPDVAAVLNVGTAHLGEFGSRKAIATAKGELVEALTEDGTAVLNADDRLVDAMAGRTVARVVRFGHAAGADVRLGEVSLDELGRPHFTLAATGQEREVRLRMLGAHQAVNAAAAAAVGVALGLPLDQVATSLAGLESLSRWRMELRERPDGLVVVNDAYNASPDSMRAALRTLAAIGERSGRRTVAVLGEMRELGAVSADEHEAVGRLTTELGIDEVVVVGEGAAGIDTGRRAVRPAATTRRLEGVDEASAWVRKNVAGADVVLVKASRAAGLERVAEELLEEGGA